MLGFIEMNRLRRLRLAGIFVIGMNLFIHFRLRVKNNSNKQIPFFFYHGAVSSFAAMLQVYDCEFIDSAYFEKDLYSFLWHGKENTSFQPAKGQSSWSAGGPAGNELILGGKCADAKVFWWLGFGVP